MVRLFSAILLLLLPSCIGAPLHSYGGSQNAQYGNHETDRVFDAIFIGMSRDELILLYGPAGRTARLDNGLRLMQYNSTTTEIDYIGNRSRSQCALRLWLRDNIVTAVDYRGDQDACARFAGDARGNVVIDNKVRR